MWLRSEDVTCLYDTVNGTAHGKTHFSEIIFNYSTNTWHIKLDYIQTTIPSRHTGLRPMCRFVGGCGQEKCVWYLKGKLLCVHLADICADCGPTSDLLSRGWTSVDHTQICYWLVWGIIAIMLHFHSVPLCKFVITFFLVFLSFDHTLAKRLNPSIFCLRTCIWLLQWYWTCIMIAMTYHSMESRALIQYKDDILPV